VAGLPAGRAALEALGVRVRSQRGQLLPKIEVMRRFSGPFCRRGGVSRGFLQEKRLLCGSGAGKAGCEATHDLDFWRKSARGG